VGHRHRAEVENGPCTCIIHYSDDQSISLIIPTTPEGYIAKKKETKGPHKATPSDKQLN
jgi:hypothetical protein